MKTLLFSFMINTLFIVSLFSQCSDCEYKSNEIWISVANELKIEQKNSLIILNDKKIDSILVKYETEALEQVFPYSKIESLKKLYKIRFNGKRDELVMALQKINTITKIIKRPIENTVETYDPSDYMWYMPSLNDPNGWLWHLKRIQAAQAWDITKGDPAIKVASIDTWFDVNHPDLTNKIYPKYDPYSSTAFNSDCQKNNHGTAVASYIAAETDGGGQLASIGFNCMLICYQAWVGSYIERAHHAAMAMHADVITSSAGGWYCSSTIIDEDKLALQEILDNGTIVVMPAGNGSLGTHCYYDGRDHPWKPLSPDYDERVIIVSSFGIDNKHQFIVNGVDKTHSHYPEVDICAPGYCIMGATCTEVYDSSANSCVPATWPYYGCETGTSFATPIVAGVCALMKSINPCLTPSQAQDFIKSTADPIIDANSYPGLIGAGRINANSALIMAGTRIYSDMIIFGNQSLSAGYAFEFTNVEIGNNSSISLTARKGVKINGTFQVPLGSSFSIEIDGNAKNDCQ